MVSNRLSGVVRDCQPPDYIKTLRNVHSLYQTYQQVLPPRPRRETPAIQYVHQDIRNVAIRGECRRVSEASKSKHPDLGMVTPTEMSLVLKAGGLAMG